MKRRRVSEEHSAYLLREGERRTVETMKRKTRPPMSALCCEAGLREGERRGLLKAARMARKVAANCFAAVGTRRRVLYPRPSLCWKQSDADTLWRHAAWCRAEAEKLKGER